MKNEQASVRQAHCLWILIFVFLNFLLQPFSAGASAGLQEKNRGALDIFCTAPAVYGGSRDETEISERIQKKINYFANCYGNAITAQDEKSFKVRFRIVVRPAGSVSEVSFVFTGTKNEHFLMCLKNILSQLQFSRVSYADGNCTVEQSVIFKII